MMTGTLRRPYKINSYKTRALVKLVVSVSLEVGNYIVVSIISTMVELLLYAIFISLFQLVSKALVKMYSKTNVTTHSKHINY